MTYGLLSPIERQVGVLTGLRESLDRESIEKYQLDKLRRVVHYTKSKSAFYEDLYRHIEPEEIKSIDDISKLPLIEAGDIVAHGGEMLCVPAREIERIVTIGTSGSEGESKRICFTESDLAETLDFFAHGMTAIAEKKDKIIVFLPNKTGYSVGSVAARGFQRGGLQAVAYGHIEDYDNAATAIKKSGANCLVGLPAQILSLAKTAPNLHIKSVLLAADYIPDSLVKSIESIWGAKVFRHYGTTETGYGGGVECACRSGYHMRAADLYFEVVDANTGARIPYGGYGEIVFTTLTRKGMPLIRYRTGDIGRMDGGPCPCGGVLPRIADVRGRIKDQIEIEGVALSVDMLDELLFSFPEIMDYRSTVKKSPKPTLVLSLKTRDGCFDEAEMRKILEPELKGKIGLLLECGLGYQTNSVKKRRILIES